MTSNGTEVGCEGRPRISEKDELLNFVSKEYGLDAAQGHGFKARLSLSDLRRLKAYADSKQDSLVRDKVGDPEPMFLMAGTSGGTALHGTP